MNSDSANDELDGVWRVSLAFWLCLLLAAAVYASVALAPKLLGYVTIRSEYLRNQADLVSLEQRVTHLERVKVALESDPQFAAELARIDFDAAPSGEERIAVEPLLSLESVPARQQSSSASAVGDLPWYTPLLELFAGNQTVRMSFLAIAAMVVLGAFTFLHECDESQECGSSPPFLLAPFRQLLARYRRDDGGKSID